MRRATKKKQRRKKKKNEERRRMKKENERKEKKRKRKKERKVKSFTTEASLLVVKSKTSSIFYFPTNWFVNFLLQVDSFLEDVMAPAVGQVQHLLMVLTEMIALKCQQRSIGFILPEGGSPDHS